MRRLLIFFAALFFFLFPGFSLAIPANVSVCFTPGGDCTDEIVKAVNSAKKEILIQAYSFTSVPIETAVINAASKRHIAVKVLLDKSQCRHVSKTQQGSAKLFSERNIFLRMDYSVAIAHNKIMIIDGEKIVTGSFNFTKNAQKSNAENSLIIDSKELAKKYTSNWNKRKNASITLAEFEAIRYKKGKHKGELKYGQCT